MPLRLKENTQCHLNDLIKLQAGGESRRHWSLFSKSFDIPINCRKNECEKIESDRTISLRSKL